MLATLKPRAKTPIYDLVHQAGHDVTDWERSASNPKKIKSNPKYCYEWAFVEAGKGVILNLWYTDFGEEDGIIRHRANYRKDAETHRRFNPDKRWAARAGNADKAIHTAWVEQLPVRVIILDGDKRDIIAEGAQASKAHFRALDSKIWAVTYYDAGTGDYEITRDCPPKLYADQFDMGAVSAQSHSPALYSEIHGKRFMRDPAVRQRVLQRAQGHCELCGQEGFRTADGRRYLETHHIDGLAEGGPDTAENVIALCADDHRRAHFAQSREDIRLKLKAIVRSKTV